MSRSSLILTGLAGLVGAIFLTALCLFITIQGWIPTLLSDPAFAWGLFLFLGAFSVAEIPVMIFGMRRILASHNPKAGYVTLFTNAAYTFFAAVYAAPFILLTGRLWSGVALASLALARFLASLVFVPHEK